MDQPDRRKLPNRLPPNRALPKPKDRKRLLEPARYPSVRPIGEKQIPSFPRLFPSVEDSPGPDLLDRVRMCKRPSLEARVQKDQPSERSQPHPDVPQK